MMKDLGDADRQHGSDDKRYKRLSELIRRFVEQSDKKSVEQCENQKRPSEKYRVGIHHGIVHVWRRACEKDHSERGQPRHQKECCDLDQANEEIPRLHDVLLTDRKQRAVKNVVRFPPVLERLKKSKADKKRA